MQVLTILAATLLGVMALLAVFCIPVDGMRQNVEKSISMLEREFSVKELIEGFHATLPGTFTDCLMLQYAVYENPEHSLMESAMNMYRLESGTEDGWMPGISLVDYFQGSEDMIELEYPRYWHGYLVILKPLLSVATFNTIRVIAAWTQLLLLGAIVIKCMKIGEEHLAKAFLVSMPFQYFFSQYFSLSLSICFYIMTAALLVQLNCHKELVRRKWYGEFFLIVGMATSYFDLLTCPLITLGFPLCVYLYMKRDTWKEGIKALVYYSFEWCVGYAGLWIMKWVAADILVGSSTIADGIAALLERSGTAADMSRLQGFFSVVWQNCKVYTNWAYVLLVAVIVIGLMIGWVKKGRWKFASETIKEGAVLLAVAFYPLVWFMFAQNHSEQHWMFTCKILSISVFAGLCAVGRLLEEKKITEA